MAKILITGGAGFIGSHLCQRLINEDNEVICLDNLFTGRKTNVSNLLKNKSFQFIEHDITEPIDLEIDQIYNLACPASPVHYQIDPVKTLKTSVIGSLNLLDIATKYNSKVLQASTSEVYGDPEVHPQSEVYWGHVNPIGMRSCYDEGKRCAETLFSDYKRQKGTNTRIVRIFNTYGPNMHPLDGRVVSNFVTQALQNKDITIYGDGSQTRSFQYIDDLINGLVKMMDGDFSGPVNLGNPDEFTIKELAEAVLEMLPKSKSKITYKPLPEDDPRQRKPDISLAREKLNWQPKTKLKAGLEKTIVYFDQLLKSEPTLFTS